MINEPQDWKHRVDQMVHSDDIDAVRCGYDEWAPSYDGDHVNFGNVLLMHFVGMFCRHVPADAGPILDAGAGTGRMGSTLSLHGYTKFVAIDLSQGMLNVAKNKPGYIATHRMRLGDRLDFSDDRFAVVASIAAFAPGHAGCEAFDDLIRVTAPNGLLILCLRAGCEKQTGFNKRRAELEKDGKWSLIDEINNFVSHPEVDPPLRYGVHVYRKS